MLLFVNTKTINQMPRIPLEAKIDLTYRCNNNCRHCWLRIPPNDPLKKQELTYDEIIDLVKQARGLGTRKWAISGGEPMLRLDFAEIFDYITRKSSSYTLNTNGTMITPRIAQLMRRKGHKMVALYGATAEVHDHVTRLPGSYEATMRGFAYLKEAGAKFTVQLIPMKDNFHEWDAMQALAESLSNNIRCGAPWLYLSASGDHQKNAEIRVQRLSPSQVVELDRPTPSMSSELPETTDESKHSYQAPPDDDRLFATCLAGRRDFHIDPYGRMSFCVFIKDPELTYALRQGSLQDGWDQFLPSLVDKVHGGVEYRENCGSCELRDDCRWCPVYGYLEHRRFSAKVDHLCEVAKQVQRFKQNWNANHQRFYQLAGVTLQVESDLPIGEQTFHQKFADFQVEGPGSDTIVIQHHFSLPPLEGKDLGKEVYRKVPWAIYQKGKSWIYRGISNDNDHPPHCLATFNHDHSRATIYHPDDHIWRKSHINALTLMSTDQILVARLLAERQGCYLHSSGVILDGQGLIFIGHSEAGKSTISRMLEPHGEVLCDDRNIVRRWPDGYRVYGTWSHGEWPVVSAASGPLRALMFLQQAPDNYLEPIADRREVVRRLIGCLIKPFVTVDWWQKMLDLIENMARELPAYHLYFDKSGDVVAVLKDYLRHNGEL